MLFVILNVSFTLFNLNEYTPGPQPKIIGIVDPFGFQIGIFIKISILFYFILEIFFSTMFPSGIFV